MDLIDNKCVESVKFVPFNSQISNGFWQKFSKLRLEQGLSTAGLKNDDNDHLTMPIYGYYGPNEIPDLVPLLQLDHSSFERQQVYNQLIRVEGQLVIKNSFEDFRDCDKNELMKNCSQNLLDSLKHQDLDKLAVNPTLLVPFFVLTYADLKKHKFTYWFGYPVISNYELRIEGEMKPIPRNFIELFEKNEKFIFVDAQGFFIFDEKINDIKKIVEIKTAEDPSKLVFGFIDPSSIENHQGWILRNYIAFLKKILDLKPGAQLKFISLRKNRNGFYGHFFNTTLNFDEAKDLITVGWEKRDDGKFGPRSVNLSDTMDPKKLSESAVDLNLKLMKWRLFPDFDLEKMHKTSVLILGAGTLGCNVARGLMGWGIRKLHLIDNGFVSYSNLARQSLYSFQDALENKPKSRCAAENLVKIFPSLETSFDQISIPMPGHPTSAATEDEFKNNYEVLVQRIKDSDVIFLLMDTRESRWLPTLLGAYYQKIVINAALGFDSYLVMRHGPGIGCYFCTDVVAPGDSTKDRTLDQQCTVTRPGISMIASGLAVELMAALLHSNETEAETENNVNVNPSTSSGGDSSNNSKTTKILSSHSLGKIPHTIRGFLSSGEVISPSFTAFDRCTACSPKVLEKYKQDGFEFVKEVARNPNCLEKLTGLEELKEGMGGFTSDDILELSDSDEF